jgi:hypothetical protein
MLGFSGCWGSCRVVGCRRVRVSGLLEGGGAAVNSILMPLEGSLEAVVQRGRPTTKTLMLLALKSQNKRSSEMFVFLEH